MFLIMMSVVSDVVDRTSTSFILYIVHMGMLYGQNYFYYLLYQLSEIFTQCKLFLNLILQIFIIFYPLGGALAGIHFDFRTSQRNLFIL